MKNEKGFVVNYPFVERKVILIQNDSIKIELDKVLTKDKITYNLGFENKTLFPIPLIMEVQDYEPTFELRLSKLFEENYYRTPDSSFVIKYEYGTSHAEWNYLYKISKNKIYLDEVFFLEPYYNSNDTIAYLSKQLIQKNIDELNMSEVKILMKKMESRDIENIKYILNKK
jgi:hypothetical protein